MPRWGGKLKLTIALLSIQVAYRGVDLPKLFSTQCGGKKSHIRPRSVHNSGANSIKSR